MSGKSLGGSLFIYNGISQDYPLFEAIACLEELCDQVVIVDAGSTDGTKEALKSLTRSDVHFIPDGEWAEHQGREKLSYFTNKAIELLDTEWNINLQADEIIHEDSFPFIRQAIEEDEEGFIIRRWNLYKDPYHILNVVQSRRPCSTEVIRLAKTKYRSWGDAESIDCQASYDYLSKIEMFHLGYVRKPDILKKKTIHMMEDIFGIPRYPQLDKSDKYEWSDYYSESDLVPIHKELPKFIQQWAKERA